MPAIKFGGASFTTSSNPTPKLFASGAYTSFANDDISSTYTSHVSASITLTSTSDVKVLWSPSRTREETSGRNSSKWARMVFNSTWLGISSQ